MQEHNTTHMEVRNPDDRLNLEPSYYSSVLFSSVGVLEILAAGRVAGRRGSVQLDSRRARKGRSRCEHRAVFCNVCMLASGHPRSLEGLVNVLELKQGEVHPCWNEVVSAVARKNSAVPLLGKLSRVVEDKCACLLEISEHYEERRGPQSCDLAW